MCVSVPLCLCLCAGLKSPLIAHCALGCQSESAPKLTVISACAAGVNWAAVPPSPPPSPHPSPPFTFPSSCLLHRLFTLSEISLLNEHNYVTSSQPAKTFSLIANVFEWHSINCDCYCDCFYDSYCDCDSDSLSPSLFLSRCDCEKCLSLSGQFITLAPTVGNNCKLTSLLIA